jgi:hypothetical protein
MKDFPCTWRHWQVAWAKAGCFTLLSSNEMKDALEGINLSTTAALVGLIFISHK